MKVGRYIQDVILNNLSHPIHQLVRRFDSLLGRNYLFRVNIGLLAIRSASMVVLNCNLFLLEITFELCMKVALTLSIQTGHELRETIFITKFPNKL